MGKASKDKRDVYYRKAKALGYRARSAFKLEQLDEQCDLLSKATNIVDLCAAPGSWSQYIARRMRDLGRAKESRIIAIDLQEMAPIEGVKMLQADITKKSTLEEILRYFGNTPADIVVSDGAPDVTGLHDIDEYVQAQLVLAALNVASQMLRPGGSFVAKVFRQKDTDLLYSQLKMYFPDVAVVKPRSSRNSSIEAFVVCRNYSPVPGFVPVIISSDPSKNAEGEALSDMNRIAVPFISAGDLSGLDSDMSYSLDADIGDLSYVPLPPVVAPIQPPYAEALRRKREADGQKQE
ncbi:FtsJ-like protein 1 [Chondrus crispus]|uniref:Putative tRNA (cytidine(32)/guanosine(34)-2'-O)-methyltransferase n=1 Tax=Chondrus crispus TaxID=2769 RepID=R7QGK6_CHOCR|nr:FtsJ-like protein 1 [Chondrus crispus]CDF37652.1 FtsJ-like protein 1 [Chondrus crispus]|eukprot:XP_005717523.1 FtsJ-like protein 1 [Chondrus crispus]